MIIKKKNKTSIQKLLVGEDRSQQEGGVGGQAREMGRGIDKSTHMSENFITNSINSFVN